MTEEAAVRAARRIIDEARDAHVFPGAAIEVGNGRQPIWRDATGTLTFDGPADVDTDTPFDLASLTKVIATTSLAMDLVDRGRLKLTDRVSVLFAEWRGEDRADVTVRDLLEHASGLPARLLEAPPNTRREFEHDICGLPLEYAPRTRSIYSDLGFVLLGFAIADRGGESLASLFGRFWPDPTLTFELSADTRRRAAPTVPMDEDLRHGRTLVGEVHDNYAAALGGAAGHAGLFGTAPAVGAFARAVLRAARDEPSGEPFVPSRVREFLKRSSVPDSSRALGWDTMLPTSSCGVHMSPFAFGHVGFTGTSLWIDPQRDRYFILLTNRACAGGTLEQMRAVRRAFHDALAHL